MIKKNPDNFSKMFVDDDNGGRANQKMIAFIQDEVMSGKVQIEGSRNAVFLILKRKNDS